MTNPSVTAPKLREMSLSEAASAVEAGAAFVDLRRVRDYLDVHIPGSLNLLHEEGPGFAGRARDCIPLDVALVLVEAGGGEDLVAAAAALQGKGFTVLGLCRDGLNAWAERDTPASTEVIGGNEASGKLLLDVGDPGATHVDGALRIPSDTLWERMDEVLEAAQDGRVVIVAGYGVRASLAVGILEKHGISDIAYWSP